IRAAVLREHRGSLLRGNAALGYRCAALAFNVDLQRRRPGNADRADAHPARPRRRDEHRTRVARRGRGISCRYRERPELRGFQFELRGHEPRSRRLRPLYRAVTSSYHIIFALRGWSSTMTGPALFWGEGDYESV